MPEKVGGHTRRDASGDVREKALAKIVGGGAQHVGTYEQHRGEREPACGLRRQHVVDDSLQHDRGAEPKRRVDERQEDRLAKPRPVFGTVPSRPAQPARRRVRGQGRGRAQQQHGFRDPHALEFRAIQSASTRLRVADHYTAADRKDYHEMAEPAVVHDMRDARKAFSSKIVEGTSGGGRFESERERRATKPGERGSVRSHVGQLSDVRQARIASMEPKYGQERGGAAIGLIVLSHYRATPGCANQRV